MGKGAKGVVASSKGQSDLSSEQPHVGPSSEIASQMEELTNELVTAYDSLIALRSKLVEVLSDYGDTGDRSLSPRSAINVPMASRLQDRRDQVHQIQMVIDDIHERLDL